jgi:hypothetical protein
LISREGCRINSSPNNLTETHSLRYEKANNPEAMIEAKAIKYLSMPFSVNVPTGYPPVGIGVITIQY